VTQSRRLAMLDRLRDWARRIKRNVLALWFALRDPRTPLPAKIVAAIVVGYALSPIDLIPDFIPVLGYLDDVILVPLGVLLAIRLIPADVWAQCQDSAQHWIAQKQGKPRSHIGAAVIVAIWLTLAYFCWRYWQTHW